MTSLPLRPITDLVLRKGDLITIVYGNYNLTLCTHVVDRNGNAETITVQLPRTTETLALSDEGRVWVRGHCRPQSVAVAAARVAQGL